MLNAADAIDHSHWFMYGLCTSIVYRLRAGQSTNSSTIQGDTDLHSSLPCVLAEGLSWCEVAQRPNTLSYLVGGYL